MSWDLTFSHSTTVRLEFLNAKTHALFENCSFQFISQISFSLLHEYVRFFFIQAPAVVLSIIYVCFWNRNQKLQSSCRLWRFLSVSELQCGCDVHPILATGRWETIHTSMTTLDYFHKLGFLSVLQEFVSWCIANNELNYYNCYFKLIINYFKIKKYILFYLHFEKREHANSLLDHWTVLF